mgnify:CR=1 FL=1
MESPNLSETFQEVLKVKPIVAKGKLENLVLDSKGLCLGLDYCYIYLPPLGKNSDIVPILSLWCNLKKRPPELRIYVEVYKYFRGKGIKGVGIRFETPEYCANHSSIHDYWHVQLTNRNRVAQVHGCPDWVPETVPCIPAMAKCPVSLTLYMLKSFYERDVFKKIINKIQIPKDYLESLPLALYY